MSPAVSSGDHFFMEGLTYFRREPHRGDIVVFSSDDLSFLDPDTLYIKRVVGEPGEHVRLADGKLFINDTLITLSNAWGPIVYDLPPKVLPQPLDTDLTIPTNAYFLAGDNARNSLDSRYFGSVPRQNIKGRIWFCYWPLSRIGSAK